MWHQEFVIAEQSRPRIRAARHITDWKKDNDSRLAALRGHFDANRVRAANGNGGRRDVLRVAGLARVRGRNHNALHPKCCHSGYAPVATSTSVVSAPPDSQERVAGLARVRGRNHNALHPKCCHSGYAPGATSTSVVSAPPDSQERVAGLARVRGAKPQRTASEEFGTAEKRGASEVLRLRRLLRLRRQTLGYFSISEILSTRRA